MEIRTLQYFLAVVREENISRAAEVLHITQPSLSRQMAALERELGAKLFIRGKRLTLTDAGALLRIRAEETVKMVGRIEDEFRQKNELGGLISIGSGGLTAMRTLAKVLTRFRELYPAVRFDFVINSADAIGDRLDRGLLDFGFLLEPVDVSRFNFLRLKVKERWGLLVPAAHPLAAKGAVTKDDLRGLPLIVSNRAPLQSEIGNWLGVPLEELNVAGTCNMVTHFAPLITAGVACALCVEGASEMFDPNKLRFLPLEPELSMTTVLAWKRMSPLFGAAGKFLDLFKSML